MLRSDQLSPPLHPWMGPRVWVDSVVAAVAESRWVTIVGPLGSGKTRLAQEVAAGRTPNAVHLQLSAQETASSLEAKLNALPTDAHPLLIVDAAERAPDAVRSLLPRWLGENEARRALVTSRLQLGPGADTTWRIPPCEEAMAYALFEQFVRNAGATFDVDGNRAALSRAFRDIGGTPLAILGLAGRSLVLGPRDLFASVSHASGRLDLPTPTGTLRDAARESWLALPSLVRPLVSALAVFAEPATPADVTTVAKLATRSLETLFAHSAIRSWTLAEQRRVEVVPTLRDFALETAPDLASQRRHRTLFLDRAQERPEHPPWRELAAAAECASEPMDALALWVAAAPAIEYAGSARRALAALERLWPAQPTPSQRLAFGSLARVAGESSRGLAELKSGYDDATQPAQRAELACALATAQRHTNDIQSARSTFESIVGSDTTPDPTRARAWERLGGLELEQGSTQLAEQHLQQAEDRFQRGGDLAGVARVRHIRGLIHQERGDFPAAELAFTVALRDHQASGAERFAAIATFDLGALLLERGRTGAARRALRQALHALQHAGDRRQVGFAHALLAVCASENEDPATAWLELQKARESVDPGDIQATETLELYASHVAGSPACVLTTESDEARYAQRLIEAIRQRARIRVSICEDGSVVEHPTRGRSEVRSDAARSILAALLVAFEDGSTSTVHRDALIRVGWPERRSIDAASRNRLNVELSRLRKAGLHDQIERSEEGYRLTGPLLVQSRSPEA